jgi:hypothetical protein
MSNKLSYLRHAAMFANSSPSDKRVVPTPASGFAGKFAFRFAPALRFILRGSNKGKKSVADPLKELITLFLHRSAHV